MRRATALFSVCLFTALTACEPAVRGNGQAALETRTIDGFLDVDSKGSLDVRVEQGDTFSVAVHIDSNLLPLVETRVVGRTLLVSSYRDLSTRLAGPHVAVTMPAVAGASLSGSGHLAVLGVQETKPVTLRLSGSGHVDFDGNAPEVRVEVGGSGDVDLAGTTDRLSANLSGSGSIDAANLPAAAGVIDLSGSGAIRATIHGPADVELSGSGDIDLFGNVMLQRLSKSGSGSINVH